MIPAHEMRTRFSFCGVESQFWFFMSNHIVRKPTKSNICEMVTALEAPNRNICGIPIDGIMLATVQKERLYSVLYKWKLPQDCTIDLALNNLRLMRPQPLSMTQNNTLQNIQEIATDQTAKYDKIDIYNLKDVQLNTNELYRRLYSPDDFDTPVVTIVECLQVKKSHQALYNALNEWVFKIEQNNVCLRLSLSYKYVGVRFR